MSETLYKGMQKQLADLQQSMEAAKAEKVRQKVSEELASLGIDSGSLRQAVANLTDRRDPRVRWDDESQSIVFKDSDGDIDLQTGLKSWAKTDDAKIYLPPRGASGSGERKPAGGIVKPVPGAGAQPGALASAVLTHYVGGGGTGGLRPPAGAAPPQGALASAVLALHARGTRGAP